MSRLSESARRVRVSLWLERLNRQAVSGQTVAEFCAAENVSVASFYQWRRRLKPRVDAPTGRRRDQRGGQPGVSAANSFAQLVVEPSPDTACARLPSGVSILLGSQPEIVAVIVDRLLQHETNDCSTGRTGAVGGPSSC